MEVIEFEKLTLLLNEAGTEYAIVGCEKDAVEVAIPKRVNGLPVVKIGAQAFEKCEKLRSVVFPDYDEEDIDALCNDEVLKEIGEYAFSGCISLVSVDISYTVTCIWWGAFCDCSSLKRAVFRENIYVGSYAFYRCKSLTDVTPVKDVYEGAFAFCESLASLPITNKTKEIAEDAFEHCYALENIVIPKSVKRIEPLAFRMCKNLKTVVFEDGEDWYVRFRYMSAEDRKLDLTNPEKNAYNLWRMDFDDGVSLWYKKGAASKKGSLDDLIDNAFD